MDKILNPANKQGKSIEVTTLLFWVISISIIVVIITIITLPAQHLMDEFHQIPTNIGCFRK